MRRAVLTSIKSSSKRRAARRLPSRVLVPPPRSFGHAPTGEHSRASFGALALRKAALPARAGRVPSAQHGASKAMAIWQWGTR